jgi:guanylate kinase
MKQKPLLRHLDEFENILEHYAPSSHSLNTLNSLPLVLLAGPTAAGRNTLIKLLVATGRYHYIVSDTTRPKRSNNGVMEQDGVEYWFKTEEEVLEGLKNGDYIEAAIIHQQQISGQNISQLETAQKADKIAINEIQNDGVANIHSFKPDTLIIFLLPPSFEVWMKRIRRRGDTTDAELRRRFESARDEISDALAKNYYQFVVNHEIHEAAQAVDEIANGRALDPEKQQLGRDHAEQLLIDVQLFLAAA